jgi:uncharacterized repeat protein (TIGR03803 family)
LLYGVATDYNRDVGGAVYRMALDGSGYTILHQFNVKTEGGFYNVQGDVPSLMEGADGYLYGATQSYGHGDGSIYRMAHDGSNFQVLHYFHAPASDGTNFGGAFVAATPIFGSDGLLYGTTTNGGNYGTGTLYRLAADGSGFTVLYNFPALSAADTNDNGAYPVGDLAFDSNGALCGIAIVGGTSGFGTVYCVQTK